MRGLQLLSFLMTPPPPRSPLFPYTTLFRSRSPTAVNQNAHCASPSLASEGLAQCALDRKSTRLNSSHANISYAVFCLKKKKSLKVGWNGRERDGTRACDHRQPRPDDRQ